MLIKYINKAMSKAVYDTLEDGSFCGKIPQCPGVIACGLSSSLGMVMNYQYFPFRKAP